MNIQTLILLKKNQKEDLIKTLSKFYKTNLDILFNYEFYMNEKTRKVHIFKGDSTIEIKKVNNIGLYFGTFHDENRFRLSIEGSQLIKPTQNYIILKKENLKSYLAAENLFKEEVEEINWKENAPFLIAKYENENLGCVNIKDNLILNYIPKSRKLDFNKLF